MNILGLDTCMRACSAAVLRDAEGAAELFHLFEERERGHAEALMPMVETVMAQAGLAYDALDRIAVTTGPGTFTGIRVGVAAARGLALATGAAVVAVTALEVIAQRVREAHAGTDASVAVACDARRGQTYFALYGGDGAVLVEPAALDAAAAAALLPPESPALLAGNGAAMVAEAAAERSFDMAPGDWLPDAATLVRMAVRRAPASGPVEPLYLRPPDAKPQADSVVARQ